MLENNHPTEGGHWYSIDGKQVESVKSKNGTQRPPTLRDARKNSYCPGVTTILKVVDKPGLQIWKQTQTLLSALTLPKIKGEALEHFADRIKKDANQQSLDARDLGVSIHAAVQEYYALTGVLKLHPRIPLYEEEVAAVVKNIAFDFGAQDWKVEQTFTSPLGYGGKVDLYAEGIVIDFKTSEFTKETTIKPYPEYGMQLAAYAKGLNLVNPKLINIYISTLEPGLVYLYEWQDPVKYWRMFKCLLEYYKISKDFANE